jgi:hypothetical protein
MSTIHTSEHQLLTAPSNGEVLLFARPDYAAIIGPIVVESGMGCQIILNRNEAAGGYADFPDDTQAFAAVVLDTGIGLRRMAGQRVSAELRHRAEDASVPKAFLVPARTMDSETARERFITENNTRPTPVGDLIVDMAKPFVPVPLQMWLGQIIRTRKRLNTN